MTDGQAQVAAQSAEQPAWQPAGQFSEQFSGQPYLLRVENLTKAFSGVEVLKNLSVGIYPGEIMGVIGENGAGKSTFMKLISGVYAPTSGQIFLDEKPVRIANPIAAQKLGIAMIPQEFNLINTLRVYENIFLGRELRRGGVLDRGGMAAAARKLFGTLETDVAPDALVADLSVAQKQMVEIAKAISQESRILIMDEPTTVLSRAEIDSLFGIMRDFAARGGAVFFVSHKLREVSEICDRVLVLRDGNLISLDPVGALDEHEMARRMVGRDLSEAFPPKAQVTTDGAGGDAAAPPLLAVRDLAVPGSINGVSFTLQAGEIVGIAGLMGAGRTELGETLMGLRRAQAGSIEIAGRPVRIQSPRDAMNAGIAYLSEDRQGRGLLLQYDTVVNITLASLKQYAQLFIQGRKAQERARYYVDSFNIRVPSLGEDLAHLSGGNQQKVYLAKWLDTGPRILILDEPTRGVDVGARHEIYGFIHELVANGLGCILISSELEEILGLSNRVLVMRGGQVAGELTGDELSEEEIMYYATGLKVQDLSQS
jgi:ribose transport system ATP-binding protein